MSKRPIWPIFMPPLAALIITLAFVFVPTSQSTSSAPQSKSTKTCPIMVHPGVLLPVPC